MIDPTSTSLIGSDASNPTLSTMWKPGRVDWTDGRVEMEVVVWRAILWVETGNNVK